MMLWGAPVGRHTHPGCNPGTPQPHRFRRGVAPEDTDVCCGKPVFGLAAFFPRPASTSPWNPGCLSLSPGRLLAALGCPRGKRHAPRVRARNSTTPQHTPRVGRGVYRESTDSTSWDNERIPPAFYHSGCAVSSLTARNRRSEASQLNLQLPACAATASPFSSKRGMEQLRVPMQKNL